MDMETTSRFFRVLLMAAVVSTAVPAWSAQEPAAPPAVATAVVNINTADAATLATALHGVGDAKAQAIVAYRQEHGPFKSLEQLAGVRGIGEALVEKNRARIVVK
jgi:competence protein ComEA